MTAIATRSGRVIDFLNPDPAQIHLQDIADGLSRMPRYCGQTEKPWNVIQHSLLVAHLVSPENRLHALLHDAPEAYLCDVPSPAKEAMRYVERMHGRQRSAYDALEFYMWYAICVRWNLALDLPAEVKAADYTAMLIEAPVLQPGPWQSEVWREHREAAQKKPPLEIGQSYFWMASAFKESTAKAQWLLAVCDELTARKVTA